jgi:hypothetical protein
MRKTARTVRASLRRLGSVWRRPDRSAAGLIPPTSTAAGQPPAIDPADARRRGRVSGPGGRELETRRWVTLDAPGATRRPTHSRHQREAARVRGACVAHWNIGRQLARASVGRSAFLAEPVDLSWECGPYIGSM